MAYHHHQGPGSGSGSASSSSSGFHLMNSPFGDTTYTKVFVGGLAWETKSEALKRHFLQFGEILEAVVITDKNSGRSKGYGFVTFREPESARKATVDPTPVIDGRRANCNLASLGRPTPAITYAQPRSAGVYYSNVPIQRGVYIGGSTYQRPVPLAYQQGYPYQQYGYSTYGSEYMYPQNMYNPYGVQQQYMQVYGGPGAGGANAGMYQYGQQINPTVQGYSPMPPAQQLVQLSGLNGAASTPRPPIQTPFLVGAVPTQHPQIIMTHQFAQNGSGHAAG
ncbi:hypothetical protein LUZ60_000069 [Juncus effusus]|nr:hypothetical protein LUZ60_000069 [Juncus effusus]